MNLDGFTDPFPALANPTFIMQSLLPFIWIQALFNGRGGGCGRSIEKRGNEKKRKNRAIFVHFTKALLAVAGKDCDHLV